jgi:hypothetical protein
VTSPLLLLQSTGKYGGGYLSGHVDTWESAKKPAAALVHNRLDQNFQVDH